MRFGRAESVLDVKISLLGEISTRAVVSTTCRLTICVLTTCKVSLFRRRIWGVVSLFRRRDACVGEPV